MQTAELQLLEAIDAMLSQDEDSLTIPYSKLGQGIKTVLEQNAKIITRLQGKIIRTLDKHLTKDDDHLDSAKTRVLAGLDDWQREQRYLLSMLAAKGGLIKAGDPLESALIDEAVKAPELAYAGTLVLQVGDAAPYLQQLVQVLREIRDRLPPLSTRVKGEAAASDDQEGEPVVDTGDDIDVPPDSPVDWPEV